MIVILIKNIPIQFVDGWLYDKICIDKVVKKFMEK